jgi:two-component system nitrate/nitrite response regulator NarL
MKILIVDDHAVLREGLAALLSVSDPKPTIIEASTPSEGFALVDEHPDLDVLLLDLIMPGIKGVEALSEFGRRRPTLPIIVLSSSEDPGDVRRALAAGALGYVPKSAGQRVLLSAIQLVLNGEVYVPLLMLTCPCRFPPVEVRVRPTEGRTDEASQVYGRADHWCAARA